MKKIILLTGIISACFFNAQIKFEKGYFIDNSGQRNEVLIKNLDWKNNPTEFEYKTNESSSINKENIKNIQEFGIDNERKYIRKTVMVDQSVEILDKISQERAPDLKEETVFLKSLVEGKASLYYYENRNIQKFFFSVDNSEIKPLIYKPFYLNNTQISYNEDYKNQLIENLTCGIDNKNIKKIKYQPNDLSKAFMNYNMCSNSTNTVNYNQISEKKDLFNLNIRPGVNFSSFKTTFASYYNVADEVTKFDREAAFRIGLEAEFLLPFNKNKWAIFAEPTYQYYKTEKESIAYAGQFFEAKSTRNVDYKSIEVPFGIRHYFFLNDKSKIFLNVAYVFDFQLNSNIQYDYQTLKINSGNNFAFGIGYKYNDKFSAEFRATTNRNLLQNYNNWTSNYQTMSLLLGYTLF
ncbi:hypothetical protein GCM10023210_33490 [Chryseobacterium ginsengisoli]|uniref:tRNA modification GTPase n=1 Tax=Chryseobacterium ginsengisoli TaxID=363853 RepID=A0ABP9ML93_9FLAO